MNHLETHQILYPNQFGFRAEHSCESQLLVIINDFAYALNNILQVDVGILDLSKPFDKVPHTRLIQILEFYRIYQGQATSMDQISFMKSIAKCVGN